MTNSKKSIGNMFLRSGIEKILADRDIKRKENLQLKKACESALEELKSSKENDASPYSNGEHLPDAGSSIEADRYFLPFELACNSKSPKIVITALDCLQKLIAYGHLTGRGADISNPERKLIDRIVEAICAPFLGQGTDETVLLQLIKAVLAVVLSTHCEVHGASLILAVRTCFNIYLTSRSPINQATAKGTLTQVINTVFGNMEKFGNIKDDETIIREVVELVVTTVVANETDETSEGGGTNRRNGSTVGESEAPLDDQFTFLNAYQKDAFLVFRALCILAQKEDGGVSNDMSLRSKLLALEMLLLVLQNSSSVLQSSQPCIIVIKRTLCMALTRNAVSSNIQVFEKSLAIFVELLDKFKAHLKASIEVFFNSVILPILDSNTCAFEQKWIVLNTIGKILANPQSVVDMFVNYDCDMTSPNLFKSIVEVVSKTTRTTINENAPPAQKEKERAMRLLGLSCLTDLLQCLVDWWQVCEVQKITSDIDDAEGSDQLQEEETTFEKFENLKHQKNLMEQGIQLFSEKPKKGLKFLQDHGFVGTDAVEVAEFMMKEERLNKTQVGDFLGDSDEFNNSVMHAYIDFLDFSSIDILAALRLFLEKFRLPGEAQKIDRLMLKFASRYLDCNPRQGIFASADAAYVLAFSIIMLTTDLHNKTVKNKMTKQGYINMNRGINEGGNIPTELLEAIFEDISKNEIKMRAGATALLRSRVTPGQGALATDKERRAMAALEMEALSETARALMESASDADTYFTPAQHQHHVKPMFKICWTPCLAAFSVGVQMSDDEEEWSLCLRGFRLGVRASSVLQATLERNAYIQALARFTLLTAKNSLGEMKSKNIEAIKLLLLIGDEDGEYLEENWVDVMKCMSSLELVQLIGTGLNSSMSHDSGSSRQYVLKATGGIDEKTLHSLQDALGETSSQSVVVAIDRIFNGSARLSSEAIVHFVRALCAVSREELSNPSAPRMFLLGKVVEVAFYNMNRIRLEWSRIWHVIGEHFNAAGCNSNEAVAYFSVDALRQLSIKFLEKGELPNFRFQKDFLRPFEVIMVKNGSAQTRDLVVRCCTHLVEAHSSRLKSGWQNLFSVWTIAAGDPSMEIVETSFLTASHVIEKRFKVDFPSFLDSFQEALKCLQEFACNSNLPDMNMEAIRLIRVCADYVSENSDKIDEAARRDDHLSNGLTADQHVCRHTISAMGWVPDEWSIDHDTLIDAGGYVQKLKLYPYFDGAHYVLTCLSVREDLGVEAVSFSRKHPFSCWLSCMLMSFAGSFLCCFLLGEPIISPLKQHNDVIFGSIAWYLIFYSPFDVVYKLTKWFPIKIILSVMKEIQRTHKIAAGVKHAGRIYPESYLVQIIVGVSKGAGSGVVKIVEQLVRGTWIPTNHEILRPSFTTKACLIASLVFTLERHSMYVTAPHDLVYLCVVGFFIYFKLASLCLSVHDVLLPIENILCAIFMGGIIDAFAKAVNATKEAVHSNRVLSEEEILAKEREKVLKKKRTALQQQLPNGVDKKYN